MEQNYVYVRLTPAHLERAKESAKIKAERGRLCSIAGCHKPLAGRWQAFFTGSLGEVILADYLRETNDSGYEILTPDDPAAFEEADVIANGWHLDVKTRSGKCGVRDGYWMFVEKGSAEHDTDLFAFSWYNRVDQSVTLLGFLERDVLLQCACRFNRGDVLDNGWTIPCDSYGVRIRELENISYLPTLLRECGIGCGYGRHSEGVRA